MKYKVGDKVRIKSLDWYNKNKSKSHGTVACGGKYFEYDMREWCGKTMTIIAAHKTCYSYIMKEDGRKHFWTDEMIEGLVVERNGKTYPYKIGDRVILKGKNRCATITDLKYNSHGNLSYYIKIDNDKDISIDYPTDLLLPIECEVEEEIEFTEEDKYWCDIMSESDPTTYVLPQGYQFVDENGNVINASKIVLEKKKPKYPQSYEECCRVMGVNHTNDLDICEHCDYKTEITYYEDSLLEKIEALYRLHICRDAYWKIAGEEMGLGKPWEPDWNIRGYYAIARSYGNVVKTSNYNCDLTFVFPTTELRDAFYETFKELIEECKELL